MPSGNVAHVLSRHRNLLRRNRRRRLHRRAAPSCRASSPRRPTCTPASAASCRRSRPAPICSDLLPVIDEALRKAGVTLDRDRLHRRAQHAGAGRRPARRRQRGQDAGRRARRAADRRQPCRGHIYACRLAAGATFFPASAWSSAAATPRCSTAAMPCTSNGSAPRSTTPPAKRSTRSPACSASAFPAGPAVEREAAGGNPDAV